MWRRGPAGAIELLLVHRPEYGDWSFPKGKCEPSEPCSTCAQREVEEETGQRGVLGAELASTAYVDGRGRQKSVRYWAMTADDSEGTDFVGNDEVDEIRWLVLDEARALLSYERDRMVLDSFVGPA